MTTNINDAINETIETFLLTNPDEETVKALIKRLQDHEQTRQGQRVMADLAWKNELPDSFPSYPRHKALRDKFRRMYNQLTKQGITVKHHPDFSGKDIEQWLLTKDGKEGRLMWFRVGSEWHLHGFTFVGENGKPLEEFSHVAYH